MADLNQCALIGRLVRNAELRYTTNGKAVAKFSIAVHEKRKEGNQWKNKADFFDLVLWGQIAESLQQYLVQGKQIAIAGKLSQERWEQDGQNRSKVVVTVRELQLLSGNSVSDNGQKQETFTTNDDGFSDDIPF
jgi:single-strand DNA-binding protein